MNKLLLLFLLSLPMFASVSRVQTLYVANGAGSSMSGILPAATATGDTLVVFVRATSHTSGNRCNVSSVTDGSGDNFINGTTVGAADPSSGATTYYNTSIYTASSIAGGTTAITINYGSTPGTGDCSVNFSVGEYSGVDVTHPIDALNGVTGTSSVTPDTITNSALLANSNANDMNVVALMTSGGSAITANNGYSYALSTRFNDFNYSDKMVYASGNQSVNYSTSGTITLPQAYFILGVSLRAANQSNYGSDPFTTFSYVQGTNKTFTPFTTSSTSPTISWTNSTILSSALVVGDTVLIAVRGTNSGGSQISVTGITDTLGNQYKLVSTSSLLAQYYDTLQLYYGTVTTGGAVTISASFNAVNGNASLNTSNYQVATTNLHIVVLRGLANATPLDVATAGNGRGFGDTLGLIESGTATSLVPQDVIIGFGIDADTSGTFVPPTGWTAFGAFTATSGSSSVTGAFDYKVVTAAGSYDPSMTDSHISSLSLTDQGNMLYAGFSTAFRSQGTVSSGGGVRAMYLKRPRNF